MAMLTATRTETTYIGGRQIKYHPSRTIIIDESIVRLTPTEYRLFLALATNSKSFSSDTELARALPQWAETPAESIDKYVQNSIKKHIDNLRSKIRPPGLEIRRIQDYGYIILEAKMAPQ